MKHYTDYIALIILHFYILVRPAGDAQAAAVYLDGSGGLCLLVLNFCLVITLSWLADVAMETIIIQKRISRELAQAMESVSWKNIEL